MTVDSELRAFLAQPENLPTALEIARHISRLCEQQHAQFWPAYEQALRERLEASQYKESWIIYKPDLNYQSAWVKRSLSPQMSLNHPRLHLLRVTFEQNTAGKGFSLYYGIQWTRKTTYPIELPEYNALRAALVRNGRELKESEWWVTTESTGYAAGRDRFILRMAHEREAFIRELVDLHWTLFLETVDYLNAYNEAVAKRVG